MLLRNACIATVEDFQRPQQFLLQFFRVFHVKLRNLRRSDQTSSKFNFLLNNLHRYRSPSLWTGRKSIICAFFFSLFTNSVWAYPCHHLVPKKNFRSFFPVKNPNISLLFSLNSKEPIQQFWELNDLWSEDWMSRQMERFFQTLLVVLATLSVSTSFGIVDCRQKIQKEKKEKKVGFSNKSQSCFEKKCFLNLKFFVHDFKSFSFAVHLFFSSSFFFQFQQNIPHINLSDQTKQLLKMEKRSQNLRKGNLKVIHRLISMLENKSKF